MDQSTLCYGGAGALLLVLFRAELLSFVKSLLGLVAWPFRSRAAAKTVTAETAPADTERAAVQARVEAFQVLMVYWTAIQAREAWASLEPVGTRTDAPEKQEAST